MRAYTPSSGLASRGPVARASFPRPLVSPATLTARRAACYAQADVRTVVLDEYRPAVGVVLVNAEGQVFAARRVNDPNSWQFPQGGIDEGEEPSTTAHRELEEETGVTSCSVVCEAEQWYSYDFPTRVRCELTGSMKQFKGQRQKWFLMRFEGHDSEVELIRPDHVQEFSEWCWMNIEDMPGLTVDFKQELYEQVTAEFTPKINEHWGSENN